MSFEWCNEESKTLLERKYLDNETVEEASHRIAKYATKILKASILDKSKFDPTIEDRIYECLEKGWFAPASPTWSNFGTGKGFSISCFSSYLEDSMLSILDTAKEIGMLSKMGGGTAAYFGDIRARGSQISLGGESDGPVAFMQIFDAVSRVVSQGGTRKGSTAVYLPIDHPDIEEFLLIRTKGNPIQDLHFAVCVKDQWLSEMEIGDKEKRKIWAKVLKARKEVGEPYIFFTDNVNNNRPPVYTDKHMYITHSNLCSEVKLFTSSSESLVCCLNALNLEKRDEWVHTHAVETSIYLQDALMESFIKDSKGVSGFEKARKFAISQRALGLGTTGFHSYLQSKMIPFESEEAKKINIEIYSNIQSRAIEASKKMAILYGKADLLSDDKYNTRHATLMAIAPNTSSSSIMGQCSPGIEPFQDNYFTVDLAGGIFIRKNKYLQKILQEKSFDTTLVWKKIQNDQGSVKNISCLSDKEKDIFKTFFEIDMNQVVKLAADRQKYIDQGQSLNLYFDPDEKPSKINKVVLNAWKSGIKTLYYQINKRPRLERKEEDNECDACSG